MNIRLWELDSGILIDLTKIVYISEIQDCGYRDKRETISKWKYEITFNNETLMFFKDTKDEAELARFKLVERWNACLDIIHPQQQTWCPEAGTFSSSSIGENYKKGEDKCGGYKESEH